MTKLEQSKRLLEEILREEDKLEDSEYTMMPYRQARALLLIARAIVIMGEK